MKAACEQEKLRVHPYDQPPVRFKAEIPELTFVYDGAVYKDSSFETLNKNFPDLMNSLKSTNPGLDWSLEPATKYGAEVQKWTPVKTTASETFFTPRTEFVGYVPAPEGSYVVVGRASSLGDGFEKASFGPGPFLRRMTKSSL